MRLVAIAGYQDSGKTTLIERLVPTLGERGRVGTVKSIHHDVEVDTPGKDTHRHRTAGADAVVGVTPSLSFQVRREAEEHDGDRRLERGLDLLGDGFAFVLAEGFKAVPVPTVLVGDVARSAVEGEILARVSDPATADVTALADRIEARGAEV
ncbi:MAG: molybdopterin-guanine dinucleotide biosynthesis protein B [Halanaeroarchaeum sp.]